MVRKVRRSRKSRIDVGCRGSISSMLSKRLPLRLHYSSSELVLSGPLAQGFYPILAAFFVYIYIHTTDDGGWGWLRLEGCVYGCITLIAGRGLSGEHRKREAAREGEWEETIILMFHQGRKKGKEKKALSSLK